MEAMSAFIVGLAAELAAQLVGGLSQMVMREVRKCIRGDDTLQALGLATPLRGIQRQACEFVRGRRAIQSHP
jgi:hypothetical protein